MALNSSNRSARGVHAAHAKADGGHGRDAGAPKGAFVPATLETAKAKDQGGASTSSNEYRSHSRKSGRYSGHTEKKQHRARKIVLVVLLVLLGVVACAGVAIALYMNDVNSKMAIQDPGEQEDLKNALEPVRNDDQPFYAMIIGSDTRGDDNGRSDTNIVVRVDTKNNQLTFISIPRDTAVNLPGHGVQKFNAAYQYDGAAGAVKAASQLLGVNISHYAEVDFDGTVSLVDALGGVDVDVPMAINDANAGGSVDQGMQHLDGQSALVFARSRSFVNGDFQRTEDQRLLLQAIVKKVQATPATQLAGIVDNVAQYVTTDMSVADILSYATQLSDGQVTMYSTMVPSSDVEVDGVSYVQCDVNTLQQMMQVIDSGGDPSTVVADTNVSSSQEAIAERAQSTPVLTPTD